MEKDEQRDLDEFSSFSIVGHSDARVNAAELLRMQSNQVAKVQKKASEESDPEIEALRDQMQAMSV